MVTVEIVARDYLVTLNYLNQFPKGTIIGDMNKTYNTAFCENGERFLCYVANNSSTILGVVVSISQAITQAIIALLISKVNFADNSK